MADTTLRPDDDQQTDDIAELEKSYAAPAYGEGADPGIDQAEAYANDPANATQKAQAAGASFFKKNKTKLIVGGIGGGIGLGTLFGVFFFLLLFKNVHIKNLFIDYEFAKFNRGFSQRLNTFVEDAKTTTPDPTAEPGTPEANLKEIKTGTPEGLQEIEANPKALEGTAKSASILDQSSAGTGGEVAQELELNRSVPDQTGKTDEEAKKAAKEAIDSEVDSKDLAKDPPLESAKDAVNEAKDTIAKSESTFAVLSNDAIKSFASKLYSGVARVTGPFIIATLSCIARDIFETGYGIYTSYKLHGLAQVATTQAKIADCQKLGKCSMAQISAVAEKSDNGKESFTDSAGYRRANHQPVLSDPDNPDDLTKNTPDLPEHLRPTYKPSGAIERLLYIAHTVLDIKIKLSSLIPGGGQLVGLLNHIPGVNWLTEKDPTLVGTDQICSVILDGRTQIGFAVVNIGGSILAAATGVVDFGLSDVAVAGVQAAAQIAGTKYGKALAIDMATHYGGALFKNISPIQWGNMMGAGTKILATDSYRKNGARPLTQAENTKVALAIRADQIKSDQQKGLAWRLWGTDNPRSVLATAVYQLPTTPTAALRRSTDTMVAAFSPSKLVRGINQLLFKPQTAMADTIEYNTYGIPDYGFTDEELNKYGVIENSKWVRARLTDLKSKYDKCFSDPYVEILGDGRSGKPEDIKYADCSSADDSFLRYRLFKLDSRVSNGLKLLLEAEKVHGL